MKGRTAKFLLATLLFNLGACFSASAYSQCTVRQVISSVERGESSRDIRYECRREVDVENCSLSQVILMARNGASEHEIYDRCGKRPD